MQTSVTDDVELHSVTCFWDFLDNSVWLVLIKFPIWSIQAMISARFEIMVKLDLRAQEANNPRFGDQVASKDLAQVRLNSQALMVSLSMNI